MSAESEAKEKYRPDDIQLVDINTLKGAEYNPRVTIEERLDQVMNSLRYLGFVLPLYAKYDGTLLSGHQRTKAAKALGYTKVPVVRLELNQDEFEKGVNLVFNKATNDIDSTENPKDLFKEFMEKALPEMSEIEPDTIYPCISSKKVSVMDYLPNVPTASKYMMVSAGKLLAKKAVMPIVVCDGEVINGVGRFNAMAHHGHTHFDAVEVPAEKKDYAYWVLNMLSMDFNIQESFKEELRFNAFRRRAVSAAIVGFSRTFSYFVFRRTVGNTRTRAMYANEADAPPDDLDLLPHLNEESRRKYVKTYGHNVVDFGCGTYHDSKLMERAGFNMLSFEPYSLPDGKSAPEAEYSRQKVGEFLDKLEAVANSGRKVDSVISSYAMNSIPHHKDRMAVLCILSALSSFVTPCFIGTQHAKASRPMALYSNPNMEANMYLGHDIKSFKAQKFFHVDEFEKMCSVFWAGVEVIAKDGTLYAKCTKPRRPNVQVLKEAIELEFDLPYSDGSTMNLVGRAKEVFGKYIRKTIP